MFIGSKKVKGIFIYIKDALKLLVKAIEIGSGVHEKENKKDSRNENLRWWLT